MEKKTALITGAARGIGRAIALTLAQEGFNVVINYAGSKEKAEAVAEDCRAVGVQAMTYQCDVADSSAVQAMIEAVVAEFGSLEVLVNNAGITADGLMLRMSEEAFDKVIDINLKGSFNCTKAAAKVMMKKRYGKIINMTSIVGIGGNAGQANYAASKAGVIALTQTTAKEFAAKNITANAVAPGFIQSDMTDALAEKTQQTMLEHIPLKHFGQPEDVANLVAFLAGDKSDYITGQVIRIDGGMAI